MSFFSMGTRVLLAVGLVGIALFQLRGMYHKVGEIEPEVFGRIAVELETTKRWCTGYTHSTHGGTLVRARQPACTTHRFETPAKRLARDGTPGLYVAMKEQHEGLGWKALLEGLHYALVWLLIVVGGRALAVRDKPRNLWLAAALGAAAFALLCAPLLLGGYGASLYSTVEGPFPLVASGPYLGLTGMPGLTITYRPLMEAVLLVPAILARLVALLPVPGWWMPVAGILGGIGFFAALGALTWWLARRLTIDLQHGAGRRRGV